MTEKNRKRLRQTNIVERFSFFSGKSKRSNLSGENKFAASSSDAVKMSANVRECDLTGKQDVVTTTAKDKSITDLPASIAGSSSSNVTLRNVDVSNENNNVIIDDETELESTSPLFNSDDGIEERLWKQLSLGTPITELKQTPKCSIPLPPLRPAPNHTILFRVDSNFDKPPKPWPNNYVDKWDEDHVRMPCSPKNVYPVTENGETKLENRWEMITTALSTSNISSAKELAEAILSYNARYDWKWSFDCLHNLFAEVDEQESAKFFQTTLPKMVHLALRLPELCTQPIPLLKQRMTHTITLTQLQVACLLANSFFCTFPRRNAQGKNTEYYNYPDINFTGLFNGGGGRVKQNSGNRKVEKLKCLLHYFRRVTTEEPSGTVSFKRQHLTNFPLWKTSQKKFLQLHVASKGTIEDNGTGMLQADFANKKMGGGVLRGGCVQEEIRFIICPELILSMLICQQMLDNECVIITGSERFSNYSGYAEIFEWTGDYRDMTSRDSWGRKYVEVVAIDAKPFHQTNLQYETEWLEREANKAYCGFFCPDAPSDKLAAVATGNWGCGAYRGDPYLKTLLQLMAAAETSRELAYFTFGNVMLSHDIYKMHTFLKEKQVTVGLLWSILEEYRPSNTGKGQTASANLYEFIYKTIEDYDNDTDVDTSASP